MEAEKLSRRSLTIDEGTFGPSHQSVAISLNGLGRILAAQNNPREAERIYRRALTIFEQLPSGDLYGKYNRDFGSLLDNLADRKTFDKGNSRLQGHPDVTKLPGLDTSTGSLGQGLSVGLGMALGRGYGVKSFTPSS